MPNMAPPYGKKGCCHGTAAELRLNPVWNTYGYRVSPPRCSGLHLSLPACPLGLKAGVQHNHPCLSWIPEGSPSSGWSVCHMATKHLVLSSFWLRDEVVPVLCCFPSLWTFIRVNDMSRLAQGPESHLATIDSMDPEC